MAHGILNGCLTILDKEAIIQCDLHDTAFLCKGAHLIVSKVAWMVTKDTATAVTAYDGLVGQLEGVIKAFLTSVTHIDHDAQTVHLADDLTTKGTDTMMCLAATSRVADVIVAIVAERHINNAAFGKVLEVFQLSI